MTFIIDLLLEVAVVLHLATIMQPEEEFRVLVLKSKEEVLQVHRKVQVLDVIIQH